MRNKLQGIIIALCAIVIVGFGGTAIASAHVITPTPTPKITVCHPTGSQSHPYTVNTISVNSEIAGDFPYLGPTTASNEVKVAWCIEHKPTPTPKPTATPTPTPKVDCDEHHGWDFWNWNPCVTPTLTPTPTPKVCIGFDGEIPVPVACPTDTPTPSEEVSPTETPSVTPTSTPGNDGGGSTPTNNAPVCTVQLTNSPLLQGEVRNSPTSVTFSWWPLQGGADHYAIIYGYAADKLYFGQSNIEGSQTSITLNDLTPNAQVFAKVTAYKGACSADSGVFSSETMPLGAPATGRAE